MKLAAAILVIAIAAGASYAAFSYYWLSPTEKFAPPREVTIEKGESFRQIARALADAGVVRSEVALRMYGRVSLTASEIKPGDYAFNGGERIPDVMRHLVKGDFIVVTITIPEGLTVHEIAERVAQTGLVCEDEFENAARDGAMVRALGLMPLGAEGYLFPATYKFSPHAKTNDVLGAMLARFYQVLTPEVEERMFEVGLDPRRLVTMASIVEKEAKAPAERPLIAGVFYNRLRLGMPLQSDPTAQYELDGAKESAASAVHTTSAFNTYDFTGLPPGPIANPGLKSIEAALNPQQTDYLYFVAREGGTHVFSKSYDEHRRVIASERKAPAGKEQQLPR
ncbi:MAG TPA: endolytic transglycosylase MltG [Candidatus Binatus sp.]|uniref:endolytic transglycosylase MltG n=1 Tax=Candidatus Binatus sp. TaxID=2811406 RepID=UPI002F423922